MNDKSDAMVNALTIDVEDYFHVRNFASYIKLEDWAELEEIAPAATYRILRLLEERKVRATFFILGWLARRHPRLVRAIQSSGHEIACHGYFHEPVRLMRPEEFRADLRAAKQLLEDTAGISVRGFRAPSFSIDQSALWAFDILLEEGFEYDSSLFPGRVVPFGFAGVYHRPHPIDCGARGTLKELPLLSLNILGREVPFAGGGFFRMYPYWMIKKGLRHANEQLKTPVAVYFHPWELAPDQPRIKADFIARTKHYLGLETMEKKITRLLADFRFVPAVELLELFC